MRIDQKLHPGRLTSFGSLRERRNTNASMLPHNNSCQPTKNPCCKSALIAKGSHAGPFQSDSNCLRLSAVMPTQIICVVLALFHSGHVSLRNQYNFVVYSEMLRISFSIQHDFGPSSIM